jgi:MFS family permease
MTSRKGSQVSHFHLVLSPSPVTEEILYHEYPGNGTEDDPYRVDWISEKDPVNPMLLSPIIKWFFTVAMAFATLSITLGSSTIAGSLPQVQQDLRVSEEVSILSISLFVVGFAIGPMTWAPMSELYGRQIMYAVTMGLSVAFGAGAAASPNIQTLLILRFLSGAAGSSLIVNAAGVLSDVFSARERGLAVTVYCSAPFLGPIIGPLCGGFLGQAAGWRWVQALPVVLGGILWIVGMIFVPETYAPCLLTKRAERLSKMTGKVYKSKLEVERGHKSAKEVFQVAMVRPWVMLIFEPIIFLLAIYGAIGLCLVFNFQSSPELSLTEKNISLVYGILYLLFAAFPIVFESQRHWSQGISGLSFLGVMIGQILGCFGYVYLDIRYRRDLAKSPTGTSPAEARLIPALIGAVLLPVGLFWFAWTNYAWMHWSVSLIGSSLFGLGEVMLFISLINYIIDAYTVFAASALAANAILRAIFGAIL